jgi:hypothetical protein
MVDAASPRPSADCLFVQVNPTQPLDVYLIATESLRRNLINMRFLVSQSTVTSEQFSGKSRRLVKIPARPPFSVPLDVNMPETCRLLLNFMVSNFHIQHQTSQLLDSVISVFTLQLQSSNWDATDRPSVLARIECQTKAKCGVPRREL